MLIFLNWRIIQSNQRFQIVSPETLNSVLDKLNLLSAGWLNVMLEHFQNFIVTFKSTSKFELTVFFLKLTYISALKITSC